MKREQWFKQWDVDKVKEFWLLDDDICYITYWNNFKIIQDTKCITNYMTKSANANMKKLKNQAFDKMWRGSEQIKW